MGFRTAKLDSLALSQRPCRFLPLQLDPAEDFMKLKFVLFALSVVFLVGISALAAHEGVGARSRTFEFTYDAVIQGIPRNARLLRVWIPVAPSDAHQAVRIGRISAAVPIKLTRNPQSGNRMLYAEVRHPRFPALEFKIVYEVTRREYSEGNYTSLMRYNQDPARWYPALEKFLLPDRLVPTTGIIKEIADTQTRGDHGEIPEAYSLYNYVFRTMRYDKSGTGWGRGDALWACDAHHGNCTDFHSLFIALARSAGIPARFSIGFPLPLNSNQGAIPGYHCWAEFYVRGLGWVPVDISEAWLTPSLHGFFFGSLDANRVRFSSGRDLMLTPQQAGPPVNYFVYPYVEIDERPFTSIRNKFTFHDLAAPVRLTKENPAISPAKKAGAL
jgi:transglutaminase-like putative cysteine protease